MQTVLIILGTIILLGIILLAFIYWTLKDTFKDDGNK